VFSRGLSSKVLRSFRESSKRKKGTAEVDAAFLAEIETGGTILPESCPAKSGLTQRELNFAVQQIIDRIVFLRICEDRRVEPYGQLRDAVKGSGVYQRLQALFVRADQRYNSGLFHFSTERAERRPDVVTPACRRRQNVTTDRELYYPDSPYEFRYSRQTFLAGIRAVSGKGDRLTPGTELWLKTNRGQEGRGVYYTPTTSSITSSRRPLGRC